jgi:uncharacterized repeat protein (TIGR01451 family)
MNRRYGRQVVATWALAAALPLVILATTLGSTLVLGPEGWDIQTVDNAGSIDADTSLALDGSGWPHISYFDSDVGHLKCARYVEGGGNCGPEGDTWQCDTIDSTAWVGRDNSLALDGSGWPHISYRDWPNQALKYAHYVGEGGNCGPGGDTWQCDTIDSAGDVGGDTSLALDGSGWPHISYRDLSNKALKYARYVGESGNCGPGGDTWQCDIIDSGGDLGRLTSLALEDSTPHISHYDHANVDLRYARYVGGGGNCGPGGDTWQCDIIDSGGDVGGYPSLALVGSIPHVSYTDWTNDGLKYAHLLGSGGNCGPGGDTWQCVTVDSPAWVSSDTSLVLAGSTPHIGYYDERDGDLRYAHHVGGSGNCGPGGDTWQCITIDSDGDAGRTASLALDGTGSPHISYYDAWSEDVRYAQRRPPLEVSKTDDPDPVITGGTLTYTLRVVNMSTTSLHATITDVLPVHVTPTGAITWSPFLTSSGGIWAETLVITVETGYVGLLQNVIQVTSLEGPSGVYTESTVVSSGRPSAYLPLVLKHPPYSDWPP